MIETKLSISPDGRYLIIAIPVRYISERTLWQEPRVDDLLTARELMTFNFIVEGKCAKEIAQYMGVSVRTVKYYLSQIYSKLSLENAKDLLRTYRQRPADKIVHLHH